MARATDTRSRNRSVLSNRQLGTGATLVVALVGSLALPKLLTLGRRAIRRIGGMTYQDQRPGAPPTADPAKGRPT